MVLGRKLAWDPQIGGTQHQGILHPPIKRIGGGNGNPLRYSCLENPHGQMSLEGFSPWGCKESNMAE